MSCSKCKKSSCCGCSSNGSNSSGDGGSSIVNIQITEITETVNNIQEAIKAFLCGHPILLIENIDDINQFDLSTGAGKGCWDGWAICDGKTHFSKSAKKNITTPNFVDRFIVQATGLYVVGATGGAATVTLDVSQIPAHNHGITDPGHDHGITDPGHEHPITDDMHTHQITVEPHRHEATLDMGAHTHDYTDDHNSPIFATAAGLVEDTNAGSIRIGDDELTFVHKDTDGGTGGQATGFTDLEAVNATSDPAATGIEVDSAITGITGTDSEVTGIVVQNAGGGLAHENLPPYFAAIYVMKI